ncbi:MAG: AI-2E family transporter [Nitriliruptoraceae bacterium]
MAADQPDATRTTARERTGLRRAGNVAWALIGIAGLVVIVGYLAGRLSLIVIPVVLALFPATLLVPVAAKLKSLGLPNSLAAVASMLLGFLLIGAIVGAMIPLVVAEGPDLIESAGGGVQEIEDFLDEDPFDLGLDGPAELLEAAREQLGELTDYTGQAAAAASATFEALAGLVLLFIILFFYLKDGRRLTEGILSLTPERSRSRIRRAADRAWQTLGRYFRGQMLVALVDAVAIGIGLLLLGIPLAAPLAVLIFFGALFPLIGALITGALAVLVALAHGGLTSALLVLALILLVQQIEGNVLQPIIIGRAIDLHPLLVLLSVTAGGVTLGILGAFLAVPLAAIVGGLISTDARDEAPDEERGSTEEDGEAMAGVSTSKGSPPDEDA